jgi:4-alpha-glucanotransferase
VDWLSKAGQRYWQVLPLGPPDRYGSPYKSRSAFACWPALLEDPRAPVSSSEEDEFRGLQQFWVGDWERRAGGRRAVHDQVRFQREWLALREYGRERGVEMIGDMPLYVAPGSVDQQAWPALFAEGLLAGAPPDEFTPVGQLWGNPVYDWPAMRRRRYRWWVERMRRAADLFDLIRIDHFRGLVAYWVVPIGSPSARSGRWRRGPGAAPLLAARRELGALSVIAEDLGVITPPVERMRTELGIPGMAVLQFLFGADVAEERTISEEAPSCDAVGRIAADRFLYTGTHDQDTLMAWWTSLDSARRAPVEAALRRRGLLRGRLDGPWPLVRLAASSPASVMMVQMSDLLGLGTTARMNTPGRAAGNWSWRMAPGAADARLARRLREVCEESGRVRS